MGTALLRPAPLTEQVAANIRARILKGELRPGERLVEQQLAKSLGVGQNAVREALIDLAHGGFVRRLANRGTYVTELTLEEARKMAEVRGALEGLAVELVAQRYARTPFDLGELDTPLAGMRSAAVANDREQFYACDLCFHQALWKLSGNEHLEQAAEQIVVPLFAFFIMLYMRTGSASGSFLEAVEAHEQVVRDIRSSGAGRARQSMEELVDLALKHQQGLMPDAR